ncbi:EAL domain-containing response regulator [Lusitaniella coriacea]|uniref:EAL domain-containing response regulator n=1 Tax=Lusitaniella coriacea TaxID=1983105 RepID=UPI003CEB669F
MTTILAIEDDDRVRDNIQDILELEDFEVITAKNGIMGLQLIRQQIPDLIICDVMMPEMDGYAVLNTLRQKKETAAIPLILLTAKANRNDWRKGMELGADDYLTKPFTPEELLKAIAACIKKRTAIKQQYTSQLQQVSDQLYRQLYYDSITNLPNRLSLRDRFGKILVNYERIKTNSTLIPVFCIGLDRFNRINDNLGYESGDLLLKAVAERLRKSVENQAVVAHLSADEFAIILTPIERKSFAQNVAEEIQKSLIQSFTINKQEIFVTASIGIALYSRDGNSIEKLLQNAKKAMTKVKHRGGNGYDFYSGLLNVGSVKKLSLEAELRHAMKREEFQVYYQPQVSLKTGKIIGCEALLRWKHPSKGFISPGVFLPLAEEVGLIEPIGEGVLEQACQDAKKLHQAGFESLRVAVNLSSRQFNQLNFRQRVIDILAHTKIRPQNLELELTESSLIQDPIIAKKRLEGFKSLGISISIDDFGTGYSSLKYLQQFPFDILKIDQCFVRDIDRNLNNAAITTAIVQMSHSLSFKVVGEGVETEAELRILKEQQCDAIQGYLFSPPLPFNKFEALLKSRKVLFSDRDRANQNIQW